MQVEDFLGNARNDTLHSWRCIKRDDDRLFGKRWKWKRSSCEISISKETVSDHLCSLLLLHVPICRCFLTLNSDNDEKK